MPDHNVTTHRNDTSRSGAYLAETELTPATVASSQFGKLYERIVNGDVYAQPLYVRGVATPSGTRNLFFIATSTNDVYAFDADDTSTDPWAGRVWQRNLNPWRPLVIGTEICTETVGSVGITSTPVIDTVTNTMYVVTRRSGGTVVASGGQLYQLHNNGRIWRYTGTPITGWQLIGDNPLTIQIAASNSSPGLFQLHRTGDIWRYDGTPITGWTRIDANPQTVGLVAAGVSGGATLTQLRDSGAILNWSGGSAWTQLDANPLTVQIASASTIGGTQLYQLHRTGAIWKYVGPGWQQLDNNPLTVKIVAAGPDLYQLHSNGNVWKYTGTPFTGWQQLDNNPATTDIVASPSGFGTPNYAKGSVLHQLHTTGKIWRYTGTPFSGWQMLDTNGATAQIVADNVTQDLYQVHIDGSIWRYTGTPCSGNNCPGWQLLDNNWALNDGANYLHAVNIADGTERRPPVVITATDAHGVRFDSRCQRQRPGLLLLGGVVYLGFGTFSCDGGAPDGQPYRGWILGYRASDLAPAGVYCTSPDGGGCGVWQSGGGLVGGPDGAIYFETGNDDVNHHAALGDSFVRLPVVAGGFGAATHFTPANADRLRDGGPLSPAAAAWYGSPTGPGDTDLGSGGPMLLPGGRLIGGGKQGRYYVLDTATMTQSQNATPGADGFQGFQAFVNTYHPTFTVRDYEMGEAVRSQHPRGTDLLVRAELRLPDAGEGLPEGVPLRHLDASRRDHASGDGDRLVGTPTGRHAGRLHVPVRQRRERRHHLDLLAPGRWPVAQGARRAGGVRRDHPAPDLVGRQPDELRQVLPAHHRRRQGHPPHLRQRRAPPRSRQDRRVRATPGHAGTHGDPARVARAVDRSERPLPPDGGATADHRGHVPRPRRPARHARHAGRSGQTAGRRCLVTRLPQHDQAPRHVRPAGQRRPDHAPLGDLLLAGDGRPRRLGRHPRRVARPGRREQRARAAGRRPGPQRQRCRPGEPLRAR